MGMTELYVSTYIEWVNRNTWFTYLLIGTFSYMNNIQRNLLWASIFATGLVETISTVLLGRDKEKQCKSFRDKIVIKYWFENCAAGSDCSIVDIGQTVFGYLLYQTER